MRMVVRTCPLDAGDYLPFPDTASFTAPCQGGAAGMGKHVGAAAGGKVCLLQTSG